MSNEPRGSRRRAGRGAERMLVQTPRDAETVSPQQIKASLMIISWCFCFNAPLISVNLSDEQNQTQTQ